MREDYEELGDAAWDGWLTDVFELVFCVSVWSLMLVLVVVGMVAGSIENEMKVIAGLGFGGFILAIGGASTAEVVGKFKNKRQWRRIEEMRLIEAARVAKE